MTVVVLQSIQVGLPRRYGTLGAADPMDQLWDTGFFKEQVVGPVRLGFTNLEGDGQADLVHHGGLDKAVLAYSAEHYSTWRQTLNKPELRPGAFGENFTVKGLTEAAICVGDRWRVGGQAVVEVSQPRQPCWKLARRWGIKTLALHVQKTGRTGWYFRTLVEGMVAPDMYLQLIERPHPAWTVERANQIMHVQKQNLQAASELASLTSLAASWKTTLLRRVERKGDPDPRKRLIGPNESMS